MMNSRARKRGKSLVLLLAATSAFEGIRAGAGTFRLLLDLPARHRVGPVAFAAFSRATDLSTAGIVFYSAYGFGGAILTAATWIVASRARVRRSVRALGAVACFCSVMVLALTTQAAPLMWRVGSATNDPEQLTQLLDAFTFWTTLRVGLADLSFLAIVSALTMLALDRQTPVPIAGDGSPLRVGAPE
jgi:hypothetical protein